MRSELTAYTNAHEFELLNVTALFGRGVNVIGNPKLYHGSQFVADIGVAVPTR